MISLRDPEALDPHRVGSKAAALAALTQAGFGVPEGFVLPVDVAGDPASVRAALRDLAGRFGEEVAWAVRSSAVAEDLPEASFAGLYATSLNVRGLDELEEAVRRVVSSVEGPVVEAYRSRAGVTDQRIAVLIQRYVDADLAGVALGADPVTGDRSAVLVSAVSGGGAPLVGGVTDADEWSVTGDRAHRRGTTTGPLTERTARQVADLLRRAESHSGGPADLEWAITGGDLFVLQMRPMTGLPAEVTWPAPLRGGWLRGIRLGEWLPEPVTPLCETWLLPRLEERIRACQHADGGFRVPGPLHTLVNGWYFHSPLGTGSQALLLLGVLRRPRLAAATVAGRWRPRLAELLHTRDLAVRWRTVTRPAYRQKVEEACELLPVAGDTALVAIVDRVADAAGDSLWSALLAGGAAWRAEIALRRLHRRLMPGTATHHALLTGLAAPRAGGDALFSLDWVRPTLGEIAAIDDAQALAAAHARLAEQRAAAEDHCATVLAGRRLRRFQRVLGAAQRAAVLRQEHGDGFGEGWPVLRGAVLRLGAALAGAGVIGAAADVFFLTRAEVEDALGGRASDLAGVAVRRRATWHEQRRLSPPEVLGRVPFLLARLLPPAEPVVAGRGLCGVAASPGQAIGPVRILLDPADIDSVRPGDVLVVSAAVPALTVLFGRIVGLCAESGSVAAHAAIVAREFGIPAVLGVTGSTRRLRDGETVLLDGTRGVIERRGLR